MECDDFEEQMETRHARITTNTFEFSDKHTHLPGKEVNTEYLGLEESRPWFRTYYLKVFASGRTETDENYVSITFVYTFACFFRTGRFIVSVKDAYGNQRFTKTFLFCKEPLVSEDSPHSCTSFHIDRYISRERLLSEPDELLPNDVLTLLIDVSFVELMYKAPELPNSYNDVFKSCFLYDDAGQPTKLLLDSPLGKLLIKESDVFRTMLEIPMTEKHTKTMDFDKEDFRAFWHIGEILTEKMTLIFSSISDIFDMYIVAHRYCILAVTGTCTTFLKLCLFDYTVEEYFEIVNECEAEGLKELLINEINLLKQTDFEEEMEKLEDGAVLRVPIRKCLWRYSHHEKNIYLSFQNVIEPPCIFYGNETFDFYK